MHQALRIAHLDVPWMYYNLVLAFIPFVLAAILTRAPRSPRLHPLRLVGWTLVVAFLPNAPYVWTDGLHLVRDLAATHTTPIALAVLIPLYALYTVVGFLPYVLTLLLIERTFVRHGWGRWVAPLRLAQYVPVGFGIYLGRIERFNSWNPFLHWHAFATTIRVQAHDARVWWFTVASILILAATTEVARLVLLRATSRRAAEDAAEAGPHVDLGRLVAFVVASSAYISGALLATAYVPALLLATVHAPGWGTTRIVAAVGCGVALAGASILAYRAVAMRREQVRGAWTTVGMLTLAAPYVGACVMLMYSALNWSIAGGVPRYLGPGRFW